MVRVLIKKEVARNNTSFKFSDLKKNLSEDALNKDLVDISKCSAFRERVLGKSRAPNFHSDR